MVTMNWESIIGHNDSIMQLRTLLNKGKMPHALLFVGPEGIGKFLVAEVTAAALFCSAANGPCGTCRSCQAFKAGAHPDFLVVEPEGQTVKIEQIRQMQKEVALSPYLAKRRVVILSGADRMTLPAANSLLKTLEEPVGDVVFILLANQRQMLLDTILSRCMIFMFRPLATQELQAALSERGVSADEACVFARLAQGSFGQALRMIEGDALQLRSQALAILECTTLPMAKFWQLSAALGEMDRVALYEVWRHLNFLLRDILILYADESSELLYNIDLRSQLLSFKSFWTKHRMFMILEETSKVEKMLYANVNTRLAMEKFLLKLRDLSVS